MNFKAIGLAALAGGATLFFVGYLVYGTLGVALLALIVMLDYFAITNIITVKGVFLYTVTQSFIIGLVAGVIGFVFGKVK